MRSNLLIGLLAMWTAAPVAAGQDIKVEARQTYNITARNPTPHAHENVLVQVKLPPAVKADHLLLLDRTHERALSLAFQMHNSVLTTMVSFEPNQTRDLAAVWSRTPVNLPQPPPRTSAELVDASCRLESNVMRYVMTSRGGAEANGMAIGIRGDKTEHPPGLGGVYLVVGDEIGFPRASSVEFEIVEQGVLMTAVRATAAVEVGGRSFTVTRTLTINADERSIADEVLVKGEAADLKDLLIGVGLRELREAAWTERAPEGYAFVARGGDDENGNALGWGVAFDPKAFVRAVELPANHAGRAVLLRPQAFGGALRSRQRLAAWSHNDPQILSVEQFEQEMQRIARRTVFTPQVRMERQARLIRE